MKHCNLSTATLVNSIIAPVAQIKIRPAKHIASIGTNIKESHINTRFTIITCHRQLLCTISMIRNKPVDWEISL